MNNFQTPEQYMARIDALRDAIVEAAKAKPHIMRTQAVAVAQCGIARARQHHTTLQQRAAYREAREILRGKR